MFSNCSKKSVYKTIEVKALECFQERSNKVCGNSRVDEGEECDPGIMYLNSDTCCHSNCTLKAGVQCRWAGPGAGAGGGYPGPGRLRTQGLWNWCEDVCAGCMYVYVCLCARTGVDPVPLTQVKCFLQAV